MTMPLIVASQLSDQERRESLYRGSMIIIPPRPSSITLAEWARHLIEEAFGDTDPRNAQYEMPVEQFVAIVGPLKPRFIHHPQTLQLQREFLRDVGGDETMYFDVPRMRVVSANGYLTSGVGHQLDAHRDTWWSAPYQQINWWTPIYPISDACSMSFFPHYWDTPVKNSSRIYNHYEWNADGRKNAALHIKSDTRKRPDLEEEVVYDPQMRPVVEVGAMIVFSGAHLHATAPNTSGCTRFSLDFRTVNRMDLETGCGATNIDAECTGTTLWEHRNLMTLERLPDALITPYDHGERSADAVLRFQPVSEMM